MGLERAWPQPPKEGWGAVVGSVVGGVVVYWAWWEFSPWSLREFLQGFKPYGTIAVGLTIGVTFMHPTWPIDAWRYFLSDSIGKRVQRTMFRTGLIVKEGQRQYMPRLVEKRRTREGWHLAYQVPEGLDLNDFKERKGKFEMSTKGECVMWASGGMVHMDIRVGEIPDFIDYFTEEILPAMKGKKLPIVIGYSRGGLVVHDAGTSGPHILTGGMTDMGKSGFIRQALVSLIQVMQPERLRLHLVDFKMVESNVFKGSVYVENRAVTVRETAAILQWLNKELDRRLALMDKANVVHITNIKNPPPYHLLVIDEFAELPDDLWGQVTRLGRLARAAGIHLILATQRPDAKTVPGDLKANLGATVAFKCKNNVNSQILLDDNAAADLPPIKGRAFYQFNGLRQVQIPFLDDGVARNIVESRGIVEQTKEAESDWE